MAATWRKCSSCKKDILCNSEYMICSVSTCQQKRTNYAFCSMECWDRHIPVERHRSDNISAIVKRAPNRPDVDIKQAPKTEPKRRVVVTAQNSAPKPTGMGSAATSVDGEVLVVASKIKKYISEVSGMNTSASTLDELTERLKEICRHSIENARKAERKTVMDRDVPKLHFVSRD